VFAGHRVVWLLCSASCTRQPTWAAEANSNRTNQTRAGPTRVAGPTRAGPTRVAGPTRATYSTNLPRMVVATAIATFATVVETVVAAVSSQSQHQQRKSSRSRVPLRRFAEAASGCEQKQKQQQQEQQQQCGRRARLLHRCDVGSRLCNGHRMDRSLTNPPRSK
jgi:hypothetical protein